MLSLENKNKKIKWLFIIVAIFLILGIIIVATCYLFEIKYKNKIYPGISIGEVDLSGLSKEQAIFLLNKKVDYINNNGINLFFDSYNAIIFPLVTSLETDLAYEIINFDTEETVNKIMNIGRSDQKYKNFLEKLSLLVKNKNLNIIFSLNQEEINKILDEHFSKYETPGKNASLVYSEQNDVYSFSIAKEKFGEVIDYQKGFSELKNKLAKLNNSPIYLQSRPSQPKIYEKDCLNIEPKAQGLINKAPLILQYEDKEWLIEKGKLVEWLILKLNNQTDPQDKIVVGIDFEKAGTYLDEILASEINIEPIDAKFEIKDSRVTEFQASQDGRELSIPKNTELIENNLLDGVEFENIELIVNIIKSKIKTENINDLGIKEIIGIGESNFSGSPANRIHNIGVGADSLDGILIKPEEEFSLLTALGEINAETGYLPELVIKDNKTIPEYGGGLCQIGTTMFRAALATGLPITMRRNHSYRVGYYEPAGTDATIYDPWPDFKFINDTPKHIVIQSRIEGNDLYFDFWGTNDGRIVEQTDPVIYNIVSPGSTKLIETLDLEPGKKKCTESAHNGADAHFDYKITHANSEIFEKRYTSHYVPWQAVCLIGVEKLTEEEIASSTEEKIE